MSTPLYALLVGVNSYKADFIPDLKGCRNDIDLLVSVLKSRFEVQPEHVRVLYDEQATHAAIQQAFREHLIDRAIQAKSAGEPAPAFLFHFSGHGEQVFDDNGDEADGYDEALVTYDAPMEYQPGIEKSLLIILGGCRNLLLNVVFTNHHHHSHSLLF